MPKQPQRTMVAQEAMDLSDIMNMSLMSKTVGEPRMRIVVNKPDGVSTEGGKLARQSITLAPALDGGTGGVVMCGWLDVKQKTAELRSHPSTAAHYTERYRKPFGIEAEDYDRLMEAVTKLLDARSIEYTFSAAMPMDMKAAARPSAAVKKQGRNLTLAITAAGAILALAIIGAALILRH